MSDLLFWLPLDIKNDLGWTLVHFAWQGVLLAALLQVLLPFCRGAVARHNCALAVLILMAWTPIATFLLLRNSGMPAPLAPAFVTGAASSASWTNALVLLWLAGIAALSLRAMAGWQLVRTLPRRDTVALPDDLLRRCHRLQCRLQVTGPVRFLLSRRVNVPTVVGWVQPVVLIPLSALSHLSPQQLDALILHELAHIRRLDTMTNMLLVLVETLLFYHPAVWWVSRQVRIEREHACDDVAVSACGDAGFYVEALTSLATIKGPDLALGANGGSLKARVARLLEGPVQPRRAPSFAVAALALLGLVIASVAVAQTKTADGYPSNDKTPVMLRPIQETHQLPPYPAESMKLKEEGRVLVGVTIATDGTVSQAVVVGASGHERLDTAAANFVKGYWRWQPAVRAGKPVTATTRVSVMFQLKKSAKKPA